MPRDILELPVSENDVVVCSDQDDRMTMGIVRLITGTSCVVQKFPSPLMGEERFTVPAQHLCVVDKTRLSKDAPLHKLILDELVAAYV